MSAAGHQGSAGAGQGAEREEYGFALEGITEASPQGFSKHGSWLSPEQRIQERERPRQKPQSLLQLVQKLRTITHALFSWSHPSTLYSVGGDSKRV